jgi:hypothetical protein
MNAMAFAGMMNMFASYMGMNMGNMSGAMGNMGTSRVENMGGTMTNMNSNQMSGHYYGVSGLSSNNNGGQEPNNYPSFNANTGTGMGGMAGYASTMYGVDPANVRAALNNVCGAGNNQFGVYNNQSSSSYGPEKNTFTRSAVGTNQGYKPY